MEGIGEIIKLLLIVLVYIFIFVIFKYVYLDIKSMNNLKYKKYPYLKLLNRRDDLSFKVSEVYNLYKNMTLGKGIKSDIVINSPYIEKCHCEIYSEDNKYFIKNSTKDRRILVNGEVIKEKIQLTNRDIIDLENLEFMFIREIGE